MIKTSNQDFLKSKILDDFIKILEGKDAKRVFSSADKVVLMREVDPEVIIRVVGAMQAAKEEAKNSLGN